MNIVFRTDASILIGTGHVMRCLTLANALLKVGANCTFICRINTGNLLDFICKTGHKAIALQENNPIPLNLKDELPKHASWLGTDWETDAKDTKDAIGELPVDWLIIDHYALDKRWENSMRSHCKKMMVIDDLADREHHCDLLLDQNLGRTPENYDKKMTNDTTKLIGPRYALLRPEFLNLRNECLKKRQKPKLEQLLVTLGGIDKDNTTGAILTALKNIALPASLEIKIVMGENSPWLREVQEIARTMQRPTQVLVNVKNMAELMVESDLCIGAAGATAWERCALGLPTLLVVLAENQFEGTVALNKAGAAEIVNSNQIIDCLNNFFSFPKIKQKLGEMSHHAFKICDGEGTKRVLSNIFKKSLSSRPANKQDDILLYNWANEPKTRENAFNSAQINFESHQTWLEKSLSEPEFCKLLIIETAGLPFGQVRFNKNNLGIWEIDYSIDRNYRNKGLGTALLECGISAFSDNVKESTLLAKVKRNNFASSRIFEHLNFELKHSKNDVLTYHKIILTNAV